jgi:hypothetical protein
MRYTENPPTVEAVQWTSEIAKAADHLTDSRYPEAEKAKFRKFDEFTADSRHDVDGTWLSIVDPHEGSEFGKWGVYCARESAWKPLYVGSWVVCYDSDSTFNVFTADEFDARYSADKRPATPAKKVEETK